MARGGIRLVHGLTKSTLITYYSGMKKDPKYAFVHAFFLICLSCSFQNLSIWPKTHPFFPILHVFTPLNDVRTYSAWSWKTTLIKWIFGRAWYPLHISSAPPPPPRINQSKTIWSRAVAESWGMANTFLEASKYKEYNIYVLIIMQHKELLKFYPVTHFYRHNISR